MIKKLARATIMLVISLMLVLCTHQTSIDIKAGKSNTVKASIAPYGEEFNPNKEIRVVETVMETEEETTEVMSYSIPTSDIELISMVVMAEAEGEPEEGKRLVIDTILNRVDSRYFPNSVIDVVYQPNQFSSMWNGRINRCYVKDDIYALVLEEVTNRSNSDVIFFRTDYYSNYGVPMYQVGNHYFSSYNWKGLDMNEQLKNLLIFSAGAIIGTVATWTFVKTKYEQMAQDEIEEIRDLYLKKSHTIEKEELKDEPTQVEEDLAEDYKKRIENLGYVKQKDIEGGKRDMKIDEPYIITPDEFGDQDNYETNTLTYYSDGVLTDETGIIVDNVDEVVGNDSLKHFGEYEDDTVFVRNDRHECDYEIQKDTRKFTDVFRH